MAYYISFLSLIITTSIASSFNGTIPKSRNCYEIGTYPLGTVIDISVQESPENCANHCIKLTDCRYFTFEPVKGMCEALSDVADDEISTRYCQDCISGMRNNFCGAHGFCKVSSYLKFLNQVYLNKINDYYREGSMNTSY